MRTLRIYLLNFQIQHVVVVQLLSYVHCFCDPRTVTCQVPLSMGIPGKNTAVGCHFLFHRIFPTQESNLSLLYWHAGSLPLSHQENPSDTAHICTCSVAQSCPFLCNPMNCSLSGSSVHGIFQARILEWVAISTSRGSS